MNLLSKRGLLCTVLIFFFISCASDKAESVEHEAIKEEKTEVPKKMTKKFTASAADIIDHRDVDIILLEHLVHEEINKIKRARGQTPLQRSTKLRNAAVDQNNYQIRIGDITHEQKNSKKRTLGDRVKVYGGGFKAMAENVLYQGFIIRTTGSKKEVITPSYQEHAKKMARSWMDSPGHRKNILNPTYDRVGTAIGYNGELHAVFATQVFGKEF